MITTARSGDRRSTPRTWDAPPRSRRFGPERLSNATGSRWPARELTSSSDFPISASAVTDQSRVDLDARGLQCGAVPVDAGAAAQHRHRSTDHGDPPVTKPEQMPHRREPAGPFAHGGDARLWQLGGRIDQHVRNVSVGEDVLIQRRQSGSDDDGPGPSGGGESTGPRPRVGRVRHRRHTTSIGLDVTPRRISTEYGLSRAVKTRSINRRPRRTG